jgi:hypothetical protein
LLCSQRIAVDAIVVTMLFEWDEDKNATNVAKHGIGF